MEGPLDTERELRKSIAQGFEPPKDSPSIFVRSFQFFLIPLGLVGACVVVYALASYLMFDSTSVKDVVIELQASGGKARAHCALQLATELRSAKARNEAIPSEVVPAIIDVMNDADGESEEDLKVRQFLAICLGLIRDERATRPLIELLDKEINPESQSACLDALGAIGDLSAAPAIEVRLNHSNPVVRRYAVFNLAAIAKKPSMSEPPRLPGAIPMIVKKLDDRSVDVKWNAAFGLAYFLGDSSGVRVLHQMLDRRHVETAIGKDPQRDNLTRHTMKMACAALWTIKDKTSVDVLTRVGKDDPDHEVRYAAQNAAREIAKD